nr:MAG TPA: hypothetical protein [Caudoviricetes sp.]
MRKVCTRIKWIIAGPQLQPNTFYMRYIAATMYHYNVRITFQ